MEEIKLEFGNDIPAPQVVAGEIVETGKKDEAAKPDEYLKDVNLTPEEEQMVADFSKQIDLNETAAVLSYGAASQKKIADFSDTALEGVRTKDLGEIGDDLAGLVKELKGFDVGEEEKKGIAGWFKKKANDLTGLKAKYDTTEKNVDKIVEVLEGHENQLTKDIVMLDKMYETNVVYFKELTMYVMAGRKKLKEEQETTLKELREKAERTGLATDAQAANDYAPVLDRFDKKLYDLELTRTICLQMAPQIRLIQNNDALMVERIQSTISNTIPLWKNQMVLALGMAHSQQALNAQKEVTDYTNELLRKNAEKLHQGSVQIAKESERGIVDIETVKFANQELISSLEEVIQIQEEGRQKRRAAEGELAQVEAELKQKLLDIKN